MKDLYTITDVRQSYAGRTVLDIPHLTVSRGERLAIVGPSGAGKSTLLRLLNFLQAPSSGRICFEGRPIDGEPSLDILRRVTTVFQTPALLNQTVRDNVAFGLNIRGEPADGRVYEALDRLDLASLADVPARRLSGGEVQRVALARALVLRTDVLLLDEPTANLDPYNVGLIEEIVRRQNADRGTTVVLVTHNLFQARRLATRVGLLLGGALIETAPVSAFFQNPGDPRTAAFVRGEMIY